MKKKVLLSLVLLTMVTASAVFAEGFSLAAGGGLLFDWSGNNGVKMEYGGESLYTGLQNLSFGGFGFFDATYAEVDVSFAYGLLSCKNEGEILGIRGEDYKYDSVLQLGFSLLGKYPINLGGFAIFPLLGINYNAVVSGKNKDGTSFDGFDLNQFGFLAGGGLDFPFSDALFLRAEALFQLRLASKAMDDIVEDAKPSPPISGFDINTTLGVGPRIKVGLGYKF